MKKAGLYVSALTMLLFCLFNTAVTFFIYIGDYLSRISFNTLPVLIPIFVSIPTFVISIIFFIKERKSMTVPFKAALFLFISAGVYFLMYVMSFIFNKFLYDETYYWTYIIFNFAHVLLLFVFSLMVFIAAAQARKANEQVSNPNFLSLKTMHQAAIAILLTIAGLNLVDTLFELVLYGSYNSYYGDYSGTLTMILIIGSVVTLVLSFISVGISKKKSTAKALAKPAIIFSMIAGIVFAGILVECYIITGFRYFSMNTTLLMGISAIVSALLSIILLVKNGKQARIQVVEEDDTEYDDDNEYIDDEE